MAWSTVDTHIQKSQSLLHQRGVSGLGLPLRSARTGWRVSIASSSANSFRPIAEYAEMGNFGVSQSLLHQRRVSARDVAMPRCQSSRSQSLLHQRGVSAAALEAMRKDGERLSQSLLHQRRVSGRSTVPFSANSQSSLNRFFISEVLPARYVLQTDKKIRVASIASSSPNSFRSPPHQARGNIVQ